VNSRWYLAPLRPSITPSNPSWVLELIQDIEPEPISVECDQRRQVITGAGYAQVSSAQISGLVHRLFPSLRAGSAGKNQCRSGGNDFSPCQRLAHAIRGAKI